MFIFIIWIIRMGQTIELVHDWNCSASKYYNIAVFIDFSYQDATSKIILKEIFHISKTI